MATHSALTPGWLNRSSMPLTFAARAPMAVASMRPIGVSIGLGTRSLFAGTRPLAISRLSGIADIAVGHWSHPIAFVRPWHQTARIDPWFGHTAHLDFRSRRHHETEMAHAPGRRGAVQRAEYTAPESAVTQWPEWADEAREAIQPDLFEMLSEEPSPALRPVASDFVPLALPGPADAVEGGSRPVATAPAVRTVVARHRTSPPTRFGIEPAQRATRTRLSPSAGAASSVMAGEAPNVPDSAEPRQAPTDATTAASASAGPTRRPVAEDVPEARIYDEARAAQPPAWPFVFVTRAMAAASSVARSVQAAGSALAASAPLIVRRVVRLAEPRSAAHGQPARGAPERKRTIADPITAVRPVSVMIAKVPPVELLLEGERTADATSSGVNTPADLPEQVLRTQRTEPTLEGGEGEVAPIAHRTESVSTGQPEPHIEASSQLSRDWPVLAAVQRLASPLASRAAAPESAAMQVVRRLSAPRRREALASVAALPSLGGGEALAADVRRPMETLLGRDLGAVRMFSAPLAATLGTEAFTSGERIVFAPGRLDTRSTRGLALLGHELAHVGQTLAFREEGGPSATDAAEEAARQQEAQVTRIIEQGWPQAPHMEVLDAARALGRLAGQSAAQTVGGQPPSAAAGGAPAAQAGGAGAPALQAPGGAAAAAPAGEGSAPADAGGGAAGGGPAGGGAGGAPAGGPAAANLDKLAQDVYGLIKARLRAEQMRHQVY